MKLIQLVVDIKLTMQFLTGIAQGDRRTNSSFKRAFVSFEEGMKCVEKIS